MTQNLMILVPNFSIGADFALILREEILAYYIEKKKEFTLVAGTYGYKKYANFKMKPINRDFFWKKFYYGKPIFRYKTEFERLLEESKIDVSALKRHNNKI